MKAMSVKQAERWLERLKAQNQQSFKDVCRFLRKYEKSEDEHECFMKVSHTLLSHAEMTKELNTYFESGNHFVVNRTEDEKVVEFMAYIKRSRPEIFSCIVTMINEIKSQFQDIHGNTEKNKLIKQSLKKISKDDEELSHTIDLAINISGQELINRLNLSHLKPKKLPPPDQDQPIQVSNTQNKHSYVKKPPRPPKEEVNEIALKPKFFILTSISEEWGAFRTLQRSLSQGTYSAVMKLVKIYFLNIISKQEVFELLGCLNLDDQLYHLRDMLDARETERRRASSFRPLNDLHFPNTGRPSPSYVTIPFSYPTRCFGRTPDLRRLLNEKWVSVPHGSEENENFSVRNKNTNEINLLKAEDERYEFDLYMGRLKITIKFLQRVESKEETNKEALIRKIIDLNVIQLVYKNTHKEQKEELECHFRVNEVEACRTIKERLLMQMKELKDIREVYANKTWSEVASKNFSKALDLKGFQFKRNEKEKMKGVVFVAELQEKVKLLEAGGEYKNVVPFFQKKQFFSICNSFQWSSRSQRCLTRTITQPQVFDMKDEQRRKFYPVVIMAFQDKNLRKEVLSLLFFYIDSAQLPQADKKYCKQFLIYLFVNSLGWAPPCKKTITKKFDQQKLYALINGTCQAEDVGQWIVEQEEEPFQVSQDNHKRSSKEQNEQNFHLDQPSKYSYLPFKSQHKKVFYGSQQLYIFMRFFYTIYQRYVRMLQVIESPDKVKLFQLLFVACIKAKESIKFEQNLNLLFNKHAYLFSTLYKLFDSLVKSLNILKECRFTLNGIFHMNKPSEDVLISLLNILSLQQNLTAQKFVRVTLDVRSNLMYFNYLESYYKSEYSIKELCGKRAEIKKKIEEYVSKADVFDRKKKRNQLMEAHSMEYVFEANTVKMINHLVREDIAFCQNKKIPLNKLLKRQFKRIHKIVERVI